MHKAIESCGAVSESEFAAFVGFALSESETEEGERPRVRTFEQAGLLTLNKGRVARVGSQECQVTIVTRR
ncbi:hypothetical protein LZC95_19710 [Pendulispora brunnea]|uniref:Uncharacterized protein n=1 Tax=Pendulispora brunnea TaxID=2905690 RepID=A0ABZ2KPP9_9BACT